MKRILAFGAGLFVVASFAGCEWQSVDSASTWSDRFSWVNFSGIYRSGSSTRAVVDSFSISNSGGGSVSTNPAPVDSGNRVTVQNESAGSASTFSTVITGQVASTHLPIVPGSVTITFSGGTGGSFRDNGSGGISGSYNMVGPDTPVAGSGNINYDTGSWNLSLGSPGLLSPVSILISYQYSVTPGATVIPPTTTPTDTSSDNSPTSGGRIYSITVQQYGNKLSFNDSNGNTYQGTISQVTTPSGDSSGLNDGEITASFEAEGSPGGVGVKMIGAFTGVYTAPKTAGGSGVLSVRTITGTWIEPNGTADILGYAGSQTVQTGTNVTAIVSQGGGL